MEKEIAIAKNEWLLSHNLSYEDEAYPVSPALILNESTGILLGVVGILILLLFFGNTITVEKEQHTWSTLQNTANQKVEIDCGKICNSGRGNPCISGDGCSHWIGSSLDFQRLFNKSSLSANFNDG